MPNWLMRVLQIAVAVSLPLVILIGNIQLLAHTRFVNYEYGKASFPLDTQIPPGGYQLSKAERTELAQIALESIAGPEGMRVLEEAQFQVTGQPAFNAREIRHMRDVRWLFQRARAGFWIGLALLVSGGAALLWWGRRTNRAPQLLTRPILISVTVALSIAFALGLYILVNFQSFFTEFHHAFFEGNTWLFRRDDTLIRLFPTAFWSDASMFIAGLTVLELVVVGAGAWFWERRSRNTG